MSDQPPRVTQGLAGALRGWLAQRADRAQRLRWLANGLLAAMAGLLLLAHGAGAGWGYVRAFAEAALVGGLADWFAVTALFRHPLGLPIPHTAIIPAKKERIAQGMAAFLQGNFLTPAVIARRMRKLDAAGGLARLLTGSGGVGQGAGGGGALSGRMAELASSLLHGRAGDYLGKLVTGTLQTQLDRLDLAPLLGQGLRAAMAQGQHRPLLDALLLRAGALLEANEDVLEATIRNRANTLMRWTGLDETLARGVLDGFYRLLAECVVDQQHPLRLRAEAMLAQLAEDLCHDPAMQAKVAQAKAAMLANPAAGQWMTGLWEKLRAAVSGGQASPPAVGGMGLVELGTALQGDAEARALVNRMARRLAVGLATRHGATLVTLVSDTVRRWDARTISDRLEAMVGRDLQFIRLNGTVVGGLVGLALHAIDGLI